MHINESILARLKSRIGNFFTTLNATKLASVDIDTSLSTLTGISSVVINTDSSIIAIGVSKTYNLSGEVLVYRKLSGIWVLDATLTSGLVNIEDGFGHSLAITEFGERIAVSAHLGTESKDVNKGHVYVYARDVNGIWVLESTLVSIGKTEHEHFGHSIALDGWGDTLVVGSYTEHTKEAELSGTVYIYTRNINKWLLTASLCPKDVTSKSLFGYSVAIDGPGMRIAVGCTHANGNHSITAKNNIHNTVSGAIYVFDRLTEHAWRQIYKFSNNDENLMVLGCKISMNYAGSVIAASGVRAVGGDHEGVFIIFNDCVKGWESSEVINSSYYLREDNFANSISLSGTGDVLVVSTTIDSKDAFSMYVYDNHKWHLDKTVLAGDASNSESSNHVHVLAINGNGNVVVSNTKYFTL